MSALLKPATIGLLAVVILTAGVPLRAQDYGTTPGAIPDPSTYQGSMQLQQQEQQQYQQQEQQNQQMLQRLDQNYQQYAPQQGPGAGGRGRGAGAPPPVDWWSKPPLPPARNPLLGRWKQIAAKGVTGQQIGAPFGGLLSSADAAASIFNGAMAGGCKSMFGTGVVAFEPDKLQWVASDGHEEILNNVAYRASGSEVVVLSRDLGAIPALIFGFPNHDHAVVAFFNCTMERTSAVRPVPLRPNASAKSTTTPRVPPLAPAASPPSGAANAVIAFRVGVVAPGSFMPLAGIQIWVTPENPAEVLAQAGFGSGDGSLAEKFSADCHNVQNCTRDLQVMTAKALGSVRTDAAGNAKTPQFPAGRYYLFGIAPYQGKALIWNRAINVQAGSNSVTLDQTNGSLARQ